MATYPDIGLPFTPPVMAERLTERDYEALEKCGIPPDCADRACLFRVDDVHGALLVGRDRAGNYAGVVFSYIPAGATVPCDYRLRRDRPGLKQGEDGKPKEDRKYLQAPGSRPRIYFPPGTKPEWLTDSRLPIVITEGEKKTLSLSVLARHSIPIEEEPRFVALGLAGVWNWRGKVGRGDGPDGDRRDVYGIIPDIVGMKWAGRKVIIIFDVNVLTNKDVAKARAALARELRDRGAQVFTVDLPAEDGVNGIDDLIGKWGADRVLTMMAESERPAGPESSITRRLAEEILKADRFAQDVGGLLYVYRKGVYKPTGAEHIRRRVKLLLETWDEDKQWSRRQVEEVVEYIRVDSPMLWDRPPLDTMNLRNCLLDVASGKTIDHTPEHLSAVQLPIDYDSGAKCPAWDAFVAQTFPDDSQDVAFEVIAWLMTPYTSVQKAILATGEGSNGKSTFLAAVTNFLGKANVSAVPLHRLEADKFAVVRLYGKLANISADLPSEHLQGTSIFKALSGEDAVLGERKYYDSFEFVPFARLVFSANNPPRSADASHAFFRRWIVIPFERTFEGPAATPRAELDASLANPKELSGVLNRALKLLGRVRAKGITESAKMQQARDEFRQVTEPLAVWLDRKTVDTGEVAKKLLLIAFNNHAERAGQPPMNQQNFGRAIKRLRPNVGEGQRGPDQHWVYTGLGFRAEEPEDK